MGCATAHFLAPPPGKGQEGQILLNFNYEVNFKEFKPNFVCLLTNERYKTYQTRFSFDHLGHAPGVGLGVPWGVSDFIWPFLRPYLGVIPNPKMVFIFPMSCILALIFPIVIKYFPKCEGKVAS